MTINDYIKLVESSGAFDKKFYRDQLKKIGIDAKEVIKHYLTEGWKSGLEPHPCFNTIFYFKSNTDIHALNTHPFLHFITHGFKEDRMTKDDFSLTNYRQLHPEVSALGINPLKHFTKNYGQSAIAFNGGHSPFPKALVKTKKSTNDINHLLSAALKLGLFDPAWYGQTYKKDFTSAFDAFADYLEKSEFSSINPSTKFDTEHYHRANLDVHHARMSPLHHYIISGKKEGRAIVPAINRWTPSKELDSGNWLSPTSATLNVAICLHIFYADYIEKFAKALDHFPISVDVYVTLAHQEHEAEVLSTFQNHPKVKKVTVRIVPNRGRNFGPLLVEFAEALKHYDLFCHLHSKKSLYSGREQTHWADYLCEYMLKDSNIITRLLNIFSTHDDLGVYYPTTYWMMPSWVNHVTMNSGHMREWETTLSLKEHRGFLSYPAGGMFWARPAALKDLLDQPFTYDSFPPEPLPNDGSMLHALERIIGAIAEKNKYKQFFFHPSSGKFTTDDSYTTMNYKGQMEGLTSQLRNFSIISFDVFDTLVRREHTVPDYAKLLLGKELEANNIVASAAHFVEIRNSAEFNLRKRSNFQGDVGLEAIYAEVCNLLEHSHLDALHLMNREFELDLSLICAKDEMVDTFNHLGSLGHILWVISDTYYSKTQVGLMLKKAGVSVPFRLLVSSEEQKRKDNGTMWHMVKSDLSSENISSYIHVGDNVVADAQIPGDLGLASFHILHPEDKWQALGFPESRLHSTPLNETEILKWGKLISCVGRVPFI
ncbi:rhamnan synthesis F family protein [Pseudomonas sp. App30]|uniref:rhamnan synthesis F family protein n=1 Tax=Pseudomonas sp. App30 TaxID=3068990 RepID=UPI003A81293E